METGLDALIRRIKETTKLCDVMEAAGVEFTSKGKEAWKARCFMHEDTSPSLSVSVNKGVFNCFSTGCEARGDVISFWRLWNNLDTMNACRTLAKKCGIDPETYLGGKPDPDRKSQDFMRGYTAILHDNLFKHGGAIKYLKQRGVSEETARRFRIGYSDRPRGHAGLSSDEYKALGLYREDLYKDTIVFPVIDPVSGKMFHYARNPGSVDGPKYVGASSVHPCRWRGPVFGLHEAKKHLRGKNERTLVLVEGFFDVLALHSHGIENVVCGMGSNVTKEQFETVAANGARKITILFDGDRAGIEGARKAAHARTPGIRLDVAFLPSGDPDEFVIKNGKEALLEVLKSALSPIEILIDDLQEALCSDGFYTKSDAIREVMLGVAALPTNERGAAINKLESMCGIGAAHIWDIYNESTTINKEVVEAEREVLAAALHRREDFVLINSRIRDAQKAFVLNSHLKIWKRLHELYERGAVEVSLDMIADVDAHAPDTAELIGSRGGTNVEYNLGVIREAACRRALEASAKRLLYDTKTQVKSTSHIISEHLNQISIELSPDLKAEFTAGEQVDVAMAYIHERMRIGGTPGITLGKKWNGLNATTLGFQNSYMYLLAAAAKAGKTATAQNWALHIAIKERVPTLWLNLEMSEQDLAIRNLSIISGLPNSNLRLGALNSTEKTILDQAAALYHSSPFYVANAAGYTAQEVINLMRKYVHTRGVRIIFLDYIQLIRMGGSKMEYWEAHMEVSTALKNAISRDLKVPLVAISQLNRYASQENTSGGANIAGSYKYIQDCDCYMGLRARTIKEMEFEVAGNVVLHVEYNRHGPQDIELGLNFNRQTLRVEEV